MSYINVLFCIVFGGGPFTLLARVQGRPSNCARVPMRGLQNIQNPLALLYKAREDISSFKVCTYGYISAHDLLMELIISY